jgi:aminoglycoside 3-N-acetyltransferase
MAADGRLPPAIDREQLAAQLRGLGVAAGGVLMVHTRMRALGWVIGGSEAVVRALLDVLGPDGTLLAYASWEEHVFGEDEWPAEHRAAYRAARPVFDIATGAARREYGRIPERLRTWPGAERSAHPDASVVAVGARARELTQDHPRDDGYGPGSPFARLVAAGGQVLMLGAPLETLTVLHHAETIADVGDKRRVTFTTPVDEGGDVVQRTFTDIDTSSGTFPYEDLGLETDGFDVIGRAALHAGVGVRAAVGQAECHLFPAAELVAFGVAWMEERFRSS